VYRSFEVISVGQNEPRYTVGEAAKRLNVKAATLRYYDDESIVKPSCVSEAGYRLYTERDIERLELVLAMRRTGLSLGDIRQALTNQKTTRTLLEQQLMLIEKQMEQLKRAKVLLETALDAIQDSSNVNLLTALRELPGVLSLSSAQQQEFILEKIIPAT
jgi:DNA-binding transcriptional MerR regulator